MSVFESHLDYLYNLKRLGVKVGLSHTIELLKRCGDPQNNFKSVHIAGTNGKGSTCAIIASILKTAGLKVGLYTSPHLIRFNERIRINNNPIENAQIVQFIEQYKSDIDEIIAQVDPFPFVPAIWTDLKLFWGSPQRFNNSIV